MANGAHNNPGNGWFLNLGRPDIVWSVERNNIAKSFVSYAKSSRFLDSKYKNIEEEEATWHLPLW